MKIKNDDEFQKYFKPEFRLESKTTCFSDYLIYIVFGILVGTFLFGVYELIMV